MNSCPAAGSAAALRDPHSPTRARMPSGLTNSLAPTSSSSFRRPAADADQFQQRFGGRRLTVTFKGQSTKPIDVFADEPPPQLLAAEPNQPPMPATTLHVVQPYDITEEGELVAAEPQQTQSTDQARRIAQRIASGHAGVIAFSRTGDASIGEYEPALIGEGKIPDELD